MTKLLALFGIVGVLAAALATARAEKPDMPPAALSRIATDVVVGEVKAVYARERVEGTYRVTRYVAEVRVKTVEKGESLEAGALVYVRYWERAWVGHGDMPPGTNGHRGLPKEGETLRIYLAQNAYDGFGTTNEDGGYSVLGANGFERLTE